MVRREGKEGQREGGSDLWGTACGMQHLHEYVGHMVGPYDASCRPDDEGGLEGGSHPPILLSGRKGGRGREGRWRR